MLNHVLVFVFLCVLCGFARSTAVFRIIDCAGCQALLRSKVFRLYSLTSKEPFHYTSKMVYMYPMIVWEFLRKAWLINAGAGRGFY